MDKFSAIKAALENILQGEPLRAIGYGAIVVVFLVTRGAEALGYTKFGEPTLDTIILSVGAAVTAVTEFARRFVYSPKTVAAVAAGAPVAATDGAVPDVANPDQ